MSGIKDVARRAGVSVGTVSNVLNRPQLVAERTREHVLAAIEDLDFVRNESARQLRAGASRTIAVVVLDIANPFFTDVVAGVESVADEQDALVVVSSSGGDEQRERRQLARLAEMRVMGVLITPVSAPSLEILRRSEVPAVLVARAAGPGERWTAGAVAVDDVRGGRAVGEHLVHRGHTRTAFLGGPLSVPQVRERQQGFLEVVGAASTTTVLTAGLSVAEGRRAAAVVLDLPQDERPTAVFCANDLVALGVLQQCLLRGVRVPEDLAIVGYDDIDYAASAAVPLSSVRQPREQLGRRAAELLLGSGDEARLAVFEPDLVPRASSARVLAPPTAG